MPKFSPPPKISYMKVIYDVDGFRGPEVMPKFSPCSRLMIYSHCVACNKNIPQPVFNDYDIPCQFTEGTAFLMAGGHGKIFSTKYYF